MTQRFFEEVQGLLSKGQMTHVGKATAAMGELYEELIVALKKQLVLRIDETGYRDRRVPF